MQPGNQSLRSLTCSVPTQATTVLGRDAALAAMGCDCLDAVTLRRISIQAVAVVGLLADQSQREGLEEAVSEDGFGKLAFVRRSAFDSKGESSTVILGESDDFRPFAPCGWRWAGFRLSPPLRIVRPHDDRAAIAWPKSISAPRVRKSCLAREVG